MHKVSIIIPCFNEQNTIKEIIEKIKTIKLPHQIEKEIIIVDDGSKDNTREILKGLRNGITIILKEKNEGKGAAIKEGLKVASGDYILIQDADLEYDPEDYVSLLEVVIDGRADIVFGSRILKKNNIPYSKIYYYGGIVLTKIFNILFGAKLTDITTCYKLFPRSMVPKLICLQSNNFIFDAVELTHQLVLSGRIVEVPIHYRARSKKEGKKLNWRHGINCLFPMLRIRFGPNYLAEKLNSKSLKWKI
ncbi:MAG: glycosyltransferase family 2 protein [Nitrospira sp.]|nr:glycosyltransferase family 2 protein [Nitrospira sp.]